jgi:hypothetical protein
MVGALENIGWIFCARLLGYTAILEIYTLRRIWRSFVVEGWSRDEKGGNKGAHYTQDKYKARYLMWTIFATNPVLDIAGLMRLLQT